MFRMIFIILAVVIGFIEENPFLNYESREAVEKYSKTQREFAKYRWCSISLPR